MSDVQKHEEATTRVTRRNRSIRKSNSALPYISASCLFLARALFEKKTIPDEQDIPLAWPEHGPSSYKHNGSIRNVSTFS